MFAVDAEVDSIETTSLPSTPALRRLTRGVAALAGVVHDTIRGQHKLARGGHRCMLVADVYIGRKPVWSRSTIKEWLISRGQVALVEGWQEVPFG